jgi:hypothetical protein
MAPIFSGDADHSNGRAKYKEQEYADFCETMIRHFVQLLIIDLFLIVLILLRKLFVICVKKNMVWIMLKSLLRPYLIRFVL